MIDVNHPRYSQISKTCLVCGKDFTIHKHREELNARFCSQICQGVARRKPLVEIKCITCGKNFMVRPSRTKGGRRKFCDRICKNKHANTTHGMSNTRLYHVWCGMRQRCGNKDAEAFKWYGARGITVCQEWQESYVAFRDWALANGYSEDLEIDRRNTNGNYTPDNCRWVTCKQQAMNTRSHADSSSKYKGVSLNKNDKKWWSYIRLDNKLRHLGRFKVEEDAARAYDAKAKELFGEYAHLNFPDDYEPLPSLPSTCGSAC